MEEYLDGPREVVILGSLGVLGACIGSFLNVVVYRLPRECMSIAHPRSRCPSCARPIAWHDNIPVISWLVLRGRCRSCQGSISFRYPLVEAFTAAAFVGLALLLVPREALREPWTGGQAWLDYLVAALVTGALVVLSLIDLDHRILPDEITKSGMLGGWLLAFLSPRFQHGRQVIRLWSDGGGWGLRADAAVNGLAGVVIAGGTLWLIGWLGAKAFRREAMGLGDVKMVAAMGGVIGLWSLLALAVAAVVGAAVGLGVRIATRGRYIPFGPFLALGMWIVMFWGPWVLDLWLGLFRAH